MRSFEKNIKFEKNNPFTIFKIENFLDRNFYEKLRLNFPNLPNHGLTNNNNMKLSFSDPSENYKKLLKSNTYFKELNDLVFSEKFFQFFYNSFFIKMLKARSNNILEVLKLCRLPVPVKNLDQNFNFFKRIFYNKIKVGIQLSYIKNDGFILPHVDNSSKLLSLMIYFPDTDAPEEKKLGTNFYYYNKPNFKNHHIDVEELESFNQESKLIYKSSFDKNILYLLKYTLDIPNGSY